MFYSHFCANGRLNGPIKNRIYCIYEYVYFECHNRPVCSRVTVGSLPLSQCWTDQLVCCHWSLNWPIGLSPLSQRWTDRLVYHHWTDVGLLDKINSDQQLMSPVVMIDVLQPWCQQWSIGGPTAMCYLGWSQIKNSYGAHC